MFFFASLVTLAFLANASLAERSPLPSYIHVCKRTDPNLEKCVLRVVEEIKPYLKKGIPELGIPSAESIVIPEIGDKNRLAAVGKNIKLTGASDFNVDKLKMDFSDESRPTFHLAVTIPHLSFNGEYEVNAKVLVLPLKGKGPIKFDAYDIKADAVLYGQIFKKRSDNYMRFVKMDMSLKIGDYSIYLGNLFNGDKLLAEATNRALNENKKEFKQALGPTVTQHVSEFILQFANNVTRNQPYDELFPK